jgi:threonine/homoserine/homoserine lactone efflux protein
MPLDYSAFLLVAFAACLLPGVEVALAFRGTLAGGRRPGLATALGCRTGQLVWGVASAVGLTAILTASSELTTVLRVAGASYLVYLGVRTALSRSRLPVEGQAKGRAYGGSSYRQGVLTNLGNPSVAVGGRLLLDGGHGPR